jgi:hypothetical protein
MRYIVNKDEYDNIILKLEELCEILEKETNSQYGFRYILYKLETIKKIEKI